MELSKRQIGQLKKIIEFAQTILADANKNFSLEPKHREGRHSPRLRRAWW